MIITNQNKEPQNIHHGCWGIKDNLIQLTGALVGQITSSDANSQSHQPTFYWVA
jgi:hypothetical protein